MKRMFLKGISKRLGTWSCYRHYSQKAKPVNKSHSLQRDPSHIRNIGILAHIDAGKTTTTERMLFYSGTIRTMGEVHHGNTVTDFMDQERQRGITITAASVTFPWGDHSINLIDTPGHIDFTMEVEQTLNVLDGAVIVLDASAGVEAQTLTVWRQANRYKIPRIVYINKMDRPDAGFFSSVNSVKTKFDETPLTLQLPYMEGKTFKGVIDVINKEVLVWEQKSLGINVLRRSVKEADGQLWEDSMLARKQLTEALADCDDSLAELIISEDQPLDNVPAARLIESVRKVTRDRKGYPIVCGSSYKNIGVQPLMDSIALYLPSPVCQIKESVVGNFGSNLYARAFKVRHVSHKGPLTFFRVYSGQLKKGQRVYNIRQDVSEQVGKILMATADDYEEVDDAGVGSIVAVTGLKSTVTGDPITSTASVANSAKKKAAEKGIKDLALVIPDPVFFCSIECPSQAYQAALDKALAELTREDPSLRVRLDEETGQTVLSGMGELHLDVIKERIRREYKVDVDLGPLHIAYKERLLTPAKDSHVVSLKIGSSQQSVNLTMSIEPCDAPRDDVLHLDRSPASASNIASIFPKHLLAVKSGIESALTRGPKLSCPIVNGKVTLHWLEVGRGTSETIIASAASQCLRKLANGQNLLQLMAVGGTQLLEPVMELEVVCPQDKMAAVNADLNRRRATPLDYTTRGTEKVVTALVPLSELLGYSTRLRSLSSGQASFSMELHSLQPMSPMDEAKAIKSVTGLDPL